MKLKQDRHRAKKMICNLTFHLSYPTFPSHIYLDQANTTESKKRQNSSSSTSPPLSLSSSSSTACAPPPPFWQTLLHNQLNVLGPAMCWLISVEQTSTDLVCCAHTFCCQSLLKGDLYCVYYKGHSAVWPFLKYWNKAKKSEFFIFHIGCKLRRVRQVLIEGNRGRLSLKFGRV